MKNKFLLASVTFLSVVSLSACTSPKKASSKSSVASSSANVVRETTNSSSNVEKKIPDNIQYTDKNTFNIIVLNAATREKANVPEGVEFNAELIAQRLESRWNDYKIVEKMTKSTTTVGGNESLKIHIFLKSGLQVAGWVFQKDDKVYLIVVEGFEKTITQFTPYVENTWSLDGTGAVTD